MPSEEYKATLEAQRTYVVEYIKKCADECRRVEKEPRRAQNNDNWNYFYGTVDWSHKNSDDLYVHLHKIGVAAERIRSKFKQGLMNTEKWIGVERKYDVPDSLLPDFVARNLLVKQLERANAKTNISDAILCGAIESRMSLKIGGKYVTKPRYVSKAGKLVRKEEIIWQLDLPVLRFEQLLTDPFNVKSPLYEIEECHIDKHIVLDMSADEPSADKPFREEAVEKLEAFADRESEEALKVSENRSGDTDRIKQRQTLLIQNFYGTVLQDNGKIYEWKTEDGKEIPLKNILAVVGNEEELIMDPQRNKRWSAKSPYVYADPLRAPGSGRKALLDAGTEINRADDELFSLMLEGARRSVHNLWWYRETWISDRKKLTGGVKAFDSLPLNDNAPANGIPAGVVKTGDVPQAALTMQGMLDRVFAENVISNQIDLSGNLPGKQVRATEVSAAGTAIKDVFDSMAGDIEDYFIVNLAEEAFLEIIQHIDEMDKEEILSCWGMRKDLGEQFLALSPSERFDQVFGIFRFFGKGLRGLIANMGKAQSLINFLNTIMANPLTAQQVETQLSAAKIGLEIARDMGIDIDRIQPDERERQMIEQKQMIREKSLADSQNAGPGQGPQQPENPASPSQGTAPQTTMSGNGQQGM